MKRIIDIVVAGAGLVVLAPLMLVLGALVRSTSPGPAVFRQTRVGYNGTPFELLKFRSMALGTPERATHEVSAGHLTSVGKFLRRTKCDELPQLWNVLRGDMSLIGPRPCLPSQAELVSARWRRGAYQVRPGITGLAQVLGVDMSQPQRLAVIDGFYVRQRSLCGDLMIGLATFKLVRIRLHRKAADHM